MDLQHWQGSSSGDHLCLNFIYILIIQNFEA